MKTYWDSSALIEALGSPDLMKRFSTGENITRTHSLAEIFSTLTGGKMQWRVDADIAAEMVSGLRKDLELIDLNDKDVLAALRAAKSKGVRGARIHDYLHAVAAKKDGAKKFLTTDKFDFEGLLENSMLELI
jgi:predicted nucleic acid-binding protein